MHKHTGHDHQLKNHFNVIGIDPQGQSVTIQYEENCWLRGQEPVQQMGWIEFLEGIMAGRFEIRAAE